MQASHVVGGGAGAFLGALLAGLLNHFTSISLSDVDAAMIGSAFLSAGVGLGHAISQYGVLGLFGVLIHGSAKKGTVIQP